jgi:hypothetical protein
LGFGAKFNADIPEIKVPKLFDSAENTSKASKKLSLILSKRAFNTSQANVLPQRTICATQSSKKCLACNNPADSYGCRLGVDHCELIR